MSTARSVLHPVVPRGSNGIPRPVVLCAVPSGGVSMVLRRRWRSCCPLHLHSSGASAPHTMEATLALLLPTSRSLFQHYTKNIPADSLHLTQPTRCTSGSSLTHSGPTPSSPDTDGIPATMVLPADGPLLPSLMLHAPVLVSPQSRSPCRQAW